VLSLYWTRVGKTFPHPHTLPHTPTRARTRTPTRTHVHTYTRTPTHARTHAHTHTHAHARAHTHAHTHAYTQIHTYTYTHATFGTHQKFSHLHQLGLQRPSTDFGPCLCFGLWVLDDVCRDEQIHHLLFVCMCVCTHVNACDDENNSLTNRMHAAFTP